MGTFSRWISWFITKSTWLANKAYQLLPLGCSTWTLWGELGSPHSQDKLFTVAFNQSIRLAVPSIITFCFWIMHSRLWLFHRNCGSWINPNISFHSQYYNHIRQPEPFPNHAIYLHNWCFCMCCSLCQEYYFPLFVISHIPAHHSRLRGFCDASLFLGQD